MKWANQYYLVAKSWSRPLTQPRHKGSLCSQFRWPAAGRNLVWISVTGLALCGGRMIYRPLERTWGSFAKAEAIFCFCLGRDGTDTRWLIQAFWSHESIGR